MNKLSNVLCMICNPTVTFGPAPGQTSASGRRIVLIVHEILPAENGSCSFSAELFATSLHASAPGVG
jgi:hypothetical protein